MTPERWQEIERLYHAAQAFAPSERDAFLARQCAGDGALRREVESLLGYASDAQKFMAAPAIEMGGHGSSGAGATEATYIGQRLGPYEIGSLLGAGGMGEVYRARDVKLGRDVAIKILPDAFTKDADRRARFEREARLLAALNHPHIGAIYGFEDRDGIHALVLELVEGETLAERLARSNRLRQGFGGPPKLHAKAEDRALPDTGKSPSVRDTGSGRASARAQREPFDGERDARGGGAPRAMNKDRPIPIDEALTIARQIADALEAAHEKGIIHRDLKPSNIMLSAGDRVKVLDFGLAKAGWTGQTGEAGGAGEDVTHSPTVTVGGTREGVILGTAAYMSPEQARGKVVDKRTDIWAFGCVLYELLTGRKAFAGDTVSDVIAAILDREPDWSALPKTIPSTVRRLLQRCLEKDLKRRLRDIGDAQLELDDRADAEVSSSPSPPALPLRIALWTLSGLIVGGLLVGLGIRFVPRATPDEVTRFAIALPPDLQLDLMALSPDGRVLVYAGSDSAGRRLYKRTLDTLESVAIRGTEGGAHPFFSPDGASVGFFARDGLKRIPLEGGLPTTISATTWSVEEGAAGTWLSDDTIVFESQSPNRGLERIPASGGEATHLTVIDKERGEVRHMWPVTVPGERALLFTVYSGARDSLRIDVVSLQSGERTALVQGSGAHVLPTGHIAFGRGGSLWVAPFDVDRLKLMGPPTAVIEGITVGLGWRPIIAVGAEGSLAYVTGASDPYPPRTLVWVDRTGREEPVDTPARAWFWPQISPDGRRLGGHIHDPVNMDAWIYELDHGPLVRMTYDARQNGTPLWSPDGTRVAFWSRQGGPRNLYLRPADLSGRPERLTTSPNDQAPLSWSGDGRLLVFHERSPDTGMDIGVVSIDGDHKSQVIIRGAFNEGRPAVSPDGRWIAYESNASGRSEVYVQPFPGLETRWQVSTEGGESPSWGPDGRELFCRRENAMIRVPVRTTGNSFRYGNSEVLFEGPYVPEEDAVGARSYAVAPDGRRFLMMKEQERHDHDGGASQIVVIRNWVSELERRAPTR